MWGGGETTLALWGAVVLSGIYHGINPGMGWPLAVSAALMKRKTVALWTTLCWLAAGHFLAMLAMLLPFSLVLSLVYWERNIRLLAGLILIGLGVFLWMYDRHPKFLSRIKPTQIMLWSFLIAMAHGAGLMLVPIYLGICQIAELDPGHRAAQTLMSSNILSALWVSLIHTAAMFVSGAGIAYVIHRWVGLRFLSTGWYNMSRVWAASLILVGLFSIATLFGTNH